MIGLVYYFSIEVCICLASKIGCLGKTVKLYCKYKI